MYSEIEYTTYLEAFLKQLPKGIFMTVKAKNEINTMVIGWANIGFLWGKKIMIVYVRGSRYTHDLLQNTSEFTVSVPLSQDLKKELNYCGVNSGKDVNKFDVCKLTPVNGRKINTPIIGECELHYECHIVHRQEVNHMNELIMERYYPNDDYHMAYYGEIKDCYLLKKT